ncbi:contact-dependent growth inhibition system immunity protein [Mycobacteroides abscessus]|uniref:contact-dependent growth inhibition system immunity protein n=1 Tax=Mycobacteroides abscessus TaxID=36809 RepID=UPI0011A126CF|nr:contact-dependent growth inhibition system immunity protein [Mycobacteroides abscessus]MBN7443420.1 hypothetical protein [Mycobacteroides abscessus subsp. abscessus]
MTYPALELLLQAYLHQDFAEIYPDAWTAVDDYLTNEPTRDQLAAEIARLLEATASNEVLLEETFYKKLGCEYYPPADGYSVRDWLAALLWRAQNARGGPIS